LSLHQLQRYSHQDEVWALWLHKSLETYRAPPHLAIGNTALAVKLKKANAVL
jgi:hypothetical protein